MPDAIFDDPRLAQVYDPLDPDRSDLDVYVDLAIELGARRCSMSVAARERSPACSPGAGLRVTAVDPARASLDVARTKPRRRRGQLDARRRHDAAAAERRCRVHDRRTSRRSSSTDDDWTRPCAGSGALRPGCARVRDPRPGRRAWEEWTPEQTRRPWSTCQVPGGRVMGRGHRRRRSARDVSLDDRVPPRRLAIESMSTLRFRSAPRSRRRWLGKDTR